MTLRGPVCTHVSANAWLRNMKTNILKTFQGDIDRHGKGAIPWRVKASECEASRPKFSLVKEKGPVNGSSGKLQIVFPSFKQG